MKDALENGHYWYLSALQTPKGLFNLFEQHLEPRYDRSSDPKESIQAAISRFWMPGMNELLDTKRKEYTEYQKSVDHIFNTLAI